MTEREIEIALQRYASCKSTDITNMDYMGTLNYIRRLKAEKKQLTENMTAILQALLGLCEWQGGVCYDVDIKRLIEKYGIEELAE